MKKGLLKVLLLLIVSTAAVYGTPMNDSAAYTPETPNFSDEDHPEY
ncbi:hypothetical protein [Thalassobacillus devorans]|nr:hypothetical protein [Thalassobacillus devorans]